MPRPNRPPTITAEPDEPGVCAPSRNSTVSNPSRTTATNATTATAVADWPTAASSLPWREFDRPRECVRIQKIIHVSKAAATKANVPSMACSVLPTNSPTTK